MNQSEILKYFLQNPDDRLQGKVVGLIGGLGSGKTTLVKRMLSSISVEFGEQVSSPTYNLCNIYKYSDFEIHHFDLYRLENEEELYDIGIMDSLENEDLVIFIEWIDLFPILFNKCDQIISISLRVEGEREYTFR